MAGRPTDYDPALVDVICEGLMDGRSLRTICDSEDMPDRSTVHRWLAIHDDFATKYARARSIQADNMFDDMQDVADTGNGADVQRARLRVATMQWRAEKLAPKKYGVKTTTALTGADGGPIETQTMPADFSSLPREVRDAVRAALKTPPPKP